MVQPVAGDDWPSVRRQCELLGLSRSGFYYEPVEVSEEEVALMRRMDQLYTARPFLGSRGLVYALGTEGLVVNRKRVQRLMRVMGLQAMVPGPHTSRPHPENPVYPYLLRNLAIVRPDQVWATDITYVPLPHGWAYLVAIMDWFSRAVLSWRLSNSMTTDFCIEALEEALRNYGSPDIFNSDQGAQFTDGDFTGVLKRADVHISMDGKGRCMDNIFIERLWRSVKYEDIYLKAYETVAEAREGIGRWMRYYNFERPHASLGAQTPMSVYRQRTVGAAA
jgi:putative transposase